MNKKSKIIEIYSPELCELIKCPFRFDYKVTRIEDHKLHCNGVCNKDTLCCVEKFLTMEICRNCSEFKIISTFRKLVMKTMAEEYIKREEIRADIAVLKDNK